MDRVTSFEDLLAIMDRLRGPDGCPWDREQTYETLRGYLLEECYEVVDSIDRRDFDGLREELGDLLFQIVFLSRLGKEEGRFRAEDVVRGIGEKMIRRHPHVFAGEGVDGSAEVLRRWEEIKRREKNGDSPDARAESVLSGVPTALPALQKAERLGRKAARVGFDWPDAEGVREKVEEEWRELAAAVADGDKDRMADELGDVLFAVAMLARHLDLDAERALEASNRKFRERFERMERALSREGASWESVGMDLLDRLWNEAKEREAR